MKNFQLDLNSTRAPLYKHWEYCVGSCHATTALRADWQEMLRQCRREIGFQYIRFHGLFDDDMSVATKPLGSDSVRLSFINIDKIFDFLLSIGMKPFIELGFMPTCMASGSKTVFHYKGNVTPPKDYGQWAWFIEEFVRHLVERYGHGEVRQWMFEVWNEPNLGGKDSFFAFWGSDMEEYFELYKVTAEAIKKVDARFRVGGPATSNNAWIPQFLSFCRERKAPVDFVTTHHYPTDIALGYGVENSSNFNTFDMSDPVVLAKLASDEEAQQEFFREYAVFKETLWQRVDRGVVTNMAHRAVEEAAGLPVYYTEWSSLAGLPSDGSFGASFIAKTVLDGINLVDGYSYWTFCDIFEEDGQISNAFHGGFGLMTQHGIPKAPYRVFELLHKLGSHMFETVFREDTVDVYVFEQKEEYSIQVLLVNHHSLMHDIQTQEVHMELANCPAFLQATIQRVDDTHANSIAAWEKMGEPEYLKPAQIQTLLSASAMEAEVIPAKHEQGSLWFEVEVPPQGCALVTVYL